jgi:hypothetical protein
LASGSRATSHYHLFLAFFSHFPAVSRASVSRNDMYLIAIERIKWSLSLRKRTQSPNLDISERGIENLQIPHIFRSSFWFVPHRLYASSANFQLKNPGYEPGLKP